MSGRHPGRRPGRPRAEEGFGDDALDAAALAMLDAEGEVTLRGVARRLGVTPMAVSHRAGGLDGLLARAAAAAHAGFAPPPEGDGAEAVVAALIAYAEAAGRHPRAVLLIFSRPDLLPPSLAAFTDWLRAQVAPRHPGDPSAAEAGVALLVDYAHGHLLAASRHPSPAMEAMFRANLRRLVAWVLDEAPSRPEGSGGERSA